MKIMSIAGKVLFEDNSDSLKVCLENAIKIDANLRYANLSDANLFYANLFGANLSDAVFALGWKIMPTKE